MSDKEIRVIKININKNDELYNVCDKYSRLAKDLYNYTNYKIRNIWLTSKNINDGKEIKPEALIKYNEIKSEIEEFNIVAKNNSKNEIEFKKQWGGDYIGGKGAKTPLKSLLKDSECFKMLPSTASSNVVEQVVNAWTGYFESLKAYTKDKSKFKGLPKAPKYKDKNGKCVFIIDKGTTNITNGVMSFKKAKKGCRSFEEFNCGNIRVNLPDWDRCKAKDGNLVYIRVVPNNNDFTIEILYEVPKNPPLKEKKGKIIGIDIGVDRLATVCNTINVKPFAINGLPLKSLNVYWNKQISNYKSNLKKTNNKNTSKKYLAMCNNRNNKMDTYMHQASSYIIKWCLKYDIDTIVIGKNKQWKQKCDIGKETQTFVQIPFAKFIDKIKYKAEQQGIEIVLQEESYTSKASFIDNEYIATYGKDDIKYKVRRKPRGIFTSDSGIKIHSDLNGAYNILRKYDNEFKYNNNFLHPYIVIPTDKIA